MSLSKSVTIKSMSAAEATRRDRERALNGLRDASFGSEIGKLHMTGQISTRERSSAERWRQIAENYSNAMLSPRPPYSMPLDIGRGGMAPDVDTPSGAVVARRHRYAVEQWQQGHAVIERAGRAAVAAVERIVERDQPPTSAVEIAHLRNGLAALSASRSRRRI